MRLLLLDEVEVRSVVTNRKKGADETRASCAGVKRGGLSSDHEHGLKVLKIRPAKTSRGKTKVRSFLGESDAIDPGSHDRLLSPRKDARERRSEGVYRPALVDRYCGGSMTRKIMVLGGAEEC